MALNFPTIIKSRDNELNVVGPQFEQEATTSKIVSIDIDADVGGDITDAAVYTVTTGKTYFINTILLSCTTRASIDLRLSIGGDEVVTVGIKSAFDQHEVNFPIPIIAESGTAITFSGNTGGGTSENFHVTLVGVEQ